MTRFLIAAAILAGFAAINWLAEGRTPPETPHDKLRRFNRDGWPDTEHDWFI